MNEVIDARYKKNPAGPLRPDQTSGLSDALYKDLVAKIVEQVYPQNSKLPSEGALANEYAVSRPIVRLALSRLRNEGIIETVQGSGSFVRQLNEPNRQFDYFPSIADLRRCLEFREHLEGEIAYLAALRRSDSALENIDSALHRLEEVESKGEQRDEKHFQFHLAIAEATENPYFLDMLRSLRNQISFSSNLSDQMRHSISPRRRRVTLDEHAEIVERIRENDEEGARSAMRRHLINARLRIFEGEWG